MNKTGLALIVISIVLIAVVAYKNFNPKQEAVFCAQDAQICPDGSYVSRVAPACSFAKCPEFKGLLNSVIYPLYPQITWGKESSSTITLKDQRLIGSQVVSEEIKNITDISKTVKPFQEYYFEKLNNSGWLQKVSFSADGPGGSEWAYYKGDDYIIFNYVSEAVNKAQNTPKTCPCNLKFSIFTGKIGK